MNLAVGILVFWIACALLWVAAHGAGVTGPFDAYKKLLGAIGGATGDTAGAGEGDGVDGVSGTSVPPVTA